MLIRLVVESAKSTTSVGRSERKRTVQKELSSQCAALTRDCQERFGRRRPGARGGSGEPYIVRGRPIGCFPQADHGDASSRECLLLAVMKEEKLEVR